MSTNPQGIVDHDIKRIEGFITSVDQADLNQNYALDIRGGRFGDSGMVFQRDFGTELLHASYPSGITIIDGFPLYVQSEAAIKDIIVGLDARGQIRIFVYDSAWIELTYFMTGRIRTISTPTNLDASIAGLQDPVGATIGNGALSVVDWVTYNLTARTSAIVTVAGSVTSAQATFTFLNQPAAAASSGGLGWGLGDSIIIMRETAMLPSDAYYPTPKNNTRGFLYNVGLTPKIRWVATQEQQKVNFLYGGGTSLTARQMVQLRKGGRMVPKSFTIGGSSNGWAAISNVNTTETPTAIDVWKQSSTITIFVAIGARIYYSSNDGTSWSTSTMPAGTQAINGIHMISSTVGYAWGMYGTMLTTTDGGANWTSINTSTIGNCNLYGGFFFASPASTGYVCGQLDDGNGHIFKTSNAGTSWTDQLTLVGVTLRDISFLEGDATKGVVCGGAAAGGGIRVEYTTDGAAWSAAAGFTVAVQINSAAIAMLSSTSAICVVDYWYGAGGYFISTVMKTDGSLAAWVETGFVWGEAWCHLSDITFYDANNGRMVGYGGTAYGVQGTSWITNNGGLTWTREWLPAGVLPFFQAEYVRNEGTLGATWYAVAAVAKVLKYNGTAQYKGIAGTNGWTAQKAGLIPDFVKFGSEVNYLATASTLTQDVGEGIKMTLDCSPTEATLAAPEDTPAKLYYMKIYMTALYANYEYLKVYQESDPIAQFFVRPSANNKVPQPTIAILIDPSIVNKNLIGFNMYVARNDANVLPPNKWIENADEYRLCWTQLVSDYLNTGKDLGWAFDAAKKNCYSVTLNHLTKSEVDQAQVAISLLSVLNHQVVLVRDYISPRYGAKTGRIQGSVIIYDENDRKLRVTSIDGYGVHEDDNLPDVPSDRAGIVKVFNPTGVGTLLGLTAANENVLTHYDGMLIAYDIVNGQPHYFPKDCVAERGIIHTDFGVYWVGRRYIEEYPMHGGPIVPINYQKWENLLDGSLKAANGTQRITDAQRSAAIAGYDPSAKEIWWQIQTTKADGSGTEYLCFRFDAQSRRWNIRKVGAIQISHFATRPDNTLTIGYASGVLRYPVKTGATRFQDVVDTTGANGQAIESYVDINLGTISALGSQHVPFYLIVKYRGSATGTRRFNIDFFEGLTTRAINPTQQRRIGASVEEKFYIGMVGQASSVRVKISFPTGDMLSVLDFNVHQMTMGVVLEPRLGTQ